MVNRDVPPQLPITVLMAMPYVAVIVCLMQAGYMLFYYAYDNGATAYLGLPPPAREMCLSQVDNDKCGRPDLFAFQVVSGITFIFCGGIAFYVWHVSKEMDVHKTPAARLYGYNASAKWLTILNFAYQIWDFSISLTIPEHCTAIMMTHHAVAGILCWSALYNAMAGYYATFFLGLSEVSSIFLVTLDFSKYFQPKPGSFFAIFVGNFSGPLFAACFIYYRVILWWPVSKQLFDDVRSVIAKGQADSLRPGRNWILYMWLGFNLPMGLLQLYWSTIILGKVKDAIMG